MSKSLWSNVWRVSRVSSLKSHSLCPNSKVAVTTTTKGRYRAVSVMILARVARSGSQNTKQTRNRSNDINSGKFISFIHFNPCHQLLSIFINFHQFSSIFIHFIHFYLFSSIFINVHPFSWSSWSSVSSIARVTSIKSSKGIITHQSHISQIQC